MRVSARILFVFIPVFFIVQRERKRLEGSGKALGAGSKLLRRFSFFALEPRLSCKLIFTSASTATLPGSQRKLTAGRCGQVRAGAGRCGQLRPAAGLAPGPGGIRCLPEPAPEGTVEFDTWKLDFRLHIFPGYVLFFT